MGYIPVQANTQLLILFVSLIKTFLDHSVIAMSTFLYKYFIFKAWLNVSLYKFGCSVKGKVFIHSYALHILANMLWIIL